MSKIETLLDKIVEKDFTGAGEEFNALISAKVAEQLDTEKVLVAAEIYEGISREEILETSEEAAEEDSEDELSKE